MDYLFLFISVTLLNCVLCDSQTPDICRNNTFGLLCNKNRIETGHMMNCYYLEYIVVWKVTIICIDGYVRRGPENYTCRLSGWDPQPNSACVKATLPTVMTTQASDITDRTSERSTATRPTSTQEPITTQASTVTEPTPESSTATRPSSIEESITTQASDVTEQTSERSTVSDKSTSALATAVSVPVVVIAVIAIVGIVAFVIWRRKQQISTAAKKTYPGTSFTNKNYQDSRGLDRHDSLLNMHSNSSGDTGYVEISSEQIQSGDNVYQTIEDSPEDQVASISGYGHLNTPVTKSADDNYSHLPANQANGKAPSDITYSHTGNTENKENLKDEIDDGEYNRLETRATTNQEKHTPEKQDDRYDDGDSEYNHATAGLPESATENIADTYSHLNSTSITLNSTSITLPATTADASIKPESIEGMRGKKEPLHEVGRDGYETAVGTAHDYFTLQPENEKERNYEDTETPNYPYFTLEKI